MLIIPTTPVPAQNLQVVLAGQACLLNIYQRLSGMYMNVYIDNGATAVIGGVICENANRIVRDAYLGFVGDLAWLDNSGDGADPYYTGLGTQFSLAYLETEDLFGLG